MIKNNSSIYQRLQKQVLPSSTIRDHLSYYKILQVFCNINGTPVKVVEKSEGIESFLAFTDQEKFSEDILNSSNIKMNENYILRPYMLGDLLKEVQSSSQVEVIKINPSLLDDQLLCEDVIFSPLKDKLTKKLMLTDPQDGLALLALAQDDQNRMGMELVFYSVTNRSTPENETRADYLQEKIKELSFIAPRTPIKKGCASLLVVLLNLENIMEEMAFIREYETLDDHSNIIFITHDLKVRAGNLEEIKYNGDHVDTILMPVINWQRSYQEIFLS